MPRLPGLRPRRVREAAPAAGRREPVQALDREVEVSDAREVRAESLARAWAARRGAVVASGLNVN